MTGEKKRSKTEILKLLLLIQILTKCSITNVLRFPTGGGPNNRINWILSSGNVTTDTSKVVNFQKSGQYPSDHYPVISDVTLHY